MADRIVTHCVRNVQGDIVAIGNPAETWFQRRSEWAITDIRRELHRYLVPGSSGTPRPIDVVDGAFGPYLRARLDSSEANNLDNLPQLELRPWEIAHEDAEILAVHAALVRHGRQGRVLLFGGDEHDRSNADDGEISNTRVYDVDRNEILNVNSPEADVFCCGHAFSNDGRLLVGGGTEEWSGVHAGAAFTAAEHWSGARECAAYDLDGTWTATANMLPEPGQTSRGGGRWYPTLITLGDGTILAAGGHPRASEDPTINDSRHGAWLPERYDPAINAWTYQPGHWIYVAWGDVGPTDPEDLDQGEELVVLPDGQSRGSLNNYRYYPRLFTMPDGRVFMASPDEGQCGWYDPATGLIDELRIDAPPHGAGLLRSGSLLGSDGNGSTAHRCAELFKSMAGVDVVHVQRLANETAKAVQRRKSVNPDGGGGWPRRRSNASRTAPTW